VDTLDPPVGDAVIPVLLCLAAAVVGSPIRSKVRPSAVNGGHHLRGSAGIDRPRLGTTTLAVGAAGLSWALVGGRWTIAVAVLAFVLAQPVTAVRRAQARGAADELARHELPMTLDLLAAVLTSGAAVPAALLAVAASGSAAANQGLLETAGLMRLGCPPEVAWASLSRNPVLGSLAAVAIRSADSGARLASASAQLAASLRIEAAARAQSRAQRAGVLVMVPLGLCFLPAFVCLGVAPVVIGVGSGLFLPVGTP
jgi:pilus assembly protein TadC